MKIQLLLLLASFFIPIAANAEYPIYSYKEKTDLNRGNYRGEAILSVSPAVAIIGKLIDVKLIFENQGRGDYYCFESGSSDSLPVTVAIFDASKTYHGDLLYQMGFSDFGIHLSYWTFLVEKERHESFFTLTAGYPEEFSNPVFKRLLSCKTHPGIYYVQAIFNSTFIAPRPPDCYEQDMGRLIIAHANGREDQESLERVIRYYNERDKIPRRDDLFRSNIVEIQLLDSAQ